MLFIVIVITYGAMPFLFMMESNVSALKQYLENNIPQNRILVFNFNIEHMFSIKSGLNNISQFFAHQTIISVYSIHFMGSTVFFPLKTGCPCSVLTYFMLGYFQGRQCPSFASRTKGTPQSLTWTTWFILRKYLLQYRRNTSFGESSICHCKPHNVFVMKHLKVWAHDNKNF